MDICVTDSLCWIVETNMTVNQLYSNKCFFFKSKKYYTDGKDTDGEKRHFKKACDKKPGMFWKTSSNIDNLMEFAQIHVHWVSDAI